MKKILIIAVLASVAMLGACTKFAAMKGPIVDDGINEAFVEYVTDKADDRLDLSDEQERQFHAMVRDMVATALEQQPQTEELRLMAAEEIRKEHLDMDKLVDIMRERADLLKLVMKSGRQDFINFHASLTPQQREAMAQLIIDHGKKGWHGGH